MHVKDALSVRPGEAKSLSVQGNLYLRQRRLLEAKSSFEASSLNLPATARTCLSHACSSARILGYCAVPTNSRRPPAAMVRPGDPWPAPFIFLRLLG